MYNTYKDYLYIVYIYKCIPNKDCTIKLGRRTIPNTLRKSDGNSSFGFKFLNNSGGLGYTMNIQKQGGFASINLFKEKLT